MSLVTHSPSAAPMPRVEKPLSQRLGRSEEHTSELQSQFHLVCRLLLEKKKKTQINTVGRTPVDLPTPKDRHQNDHNIIVLILTSTHISHPHTHLSIAPSQQSAPGTDSQ